MGYTHYWDNGRALTADEAIGIEVDIRSVLQATNVPVAGADGTGSVAFGDGDSMIVSLNGIEEGDACHETFYFPGDAGFNFCKTAYKPYDEVVTAILIIAADRAPGAFEISSDGAGEDWAPGLKLATRALGRKLNLPILGGS